MPRRPTPKSAATANDDNDADAIDASFTEETTPEATQFEQPAPAQASVPLTRGAILEAARSLNSAAMGTAAWIESHCMSGHIRPLFIDSWRKWHGGLLAFTASFERLPMNLVDAQRTVARQQELLEQWRAGARGEVAAMGGAEVGAAAQGQGQGQHVQAQQQAAPSHRTMADAVSHWPWWAKVGITGGLVYGTFVASRYLLQTWAGSPTPAPASTTEAKAK